MKPKHVYFSIAFVFIIVGLVLWQLNDIYRDEKQNQKQSFQQTQLTSLRTTVSAQISQMRNTVSTYFLKIDEKQINWVQLKPFYFLGLIKESQSGQITVEQVYTLVGSKAESWSASSVQRYFKAPIRGDDLTKVKVFQDAFGDKHTAVIFFDKDLRSNMQRTGVMLIGDVSFLQNFFELQRSQLTTQTLLTNDQLVVAHSQFNYVSHTSDEAKASKDKFFTERQEIRGTNLFLFSYSPIKSSAMIHIPYSVVGLILGLTFLISGVLVFIAKPLDKAVRLAEKNHRDQLFQKTVSEQLQGPVEQKPAEQKITFGSAVIKKVDEKTNPNFPKTPPPQAVDSSGAQVVSRIKWPDELSIVNSNVVQASFQQSLFNVDRLLKNAQITVSKSFNSSEPVQVDQAFLVYFFDYFLSDMANNSQHLKHLVMNVRTYDADHFTTLEIQSAYKKKWMTDDLKNLFQKMSCHIQDSENANGDSVLQFIFTRPLGQIADITKTNHAYIQDEVTLTTAHADLKTDLDLDKLLSLDDDIVKNEMQPSQYKIDQRINIIEEPVLSHSLRQGSELDQFQAQIRKPQPKAKES